MIKSLRNAVAHHEAVWHDLALSQKYHAMLQALGWLSKDLEHALRSPALDPFWPVYRGSVKRYAAPLAALAHKAEP
jgi:hypothetical protein